MRLNHPLRALFACAAVGSSVLAMACSQEVGTPTAGAQESAPLSACIFGDGGLCVDVDGGIPLPVPLPPVPLPIPLDGGLPSLGADGGLPIPLPVPTWPVPIPVPIPPPVGGGVGADGGAAACDVHNPKYLTEYTQALKSGQTTPCSACSSTDCCFMTLACVAQ